MQEGEGHNGSKASKVVFLGRQNQLFTTGFSKSSERQYALWDAVSMRLLTWGLPAVCCCGMCLFTTMSSSSLSLSSTASIMWAWTNPRCGNVVKRTEFAFWFSWGHDSWLVLQGGHSSGKPVKVRELKSGQGKVKENRKNREKSGKMNYFNYSVATIIVQTEICNNEVRYLIKFFVRCSLIEEIAFLTCTYSYGIYLEMSAFFMSLLLRGSIISKCSLKMSGKVSEFDDDWRVATL